MPEDFGLHCVPMVGHLTPLVDLVGIGDRVRVATDPGSLSYWGRLRLAEGLERPQDSDKGWFLMAVESGQRCSTATIHRSSLDAVDLLHAGNALCGVIDWLKIDRADEEKVLAALKTVDVPWSRPYWRGEPAPTEEEKAAVRAMRRAAFERLFPTLKKTE